MNVRPLRDKILVKPNPVQEVSKGGIIIPETAKDAPVEGTVIAVGSGILNREGNTIPLDVNVNDKILFRKNNNATEIESDGEKYYVMSEMDVLAVIE